MADLRIHSQFTLTLSKEELLLVQRALRGVLAEHERQPARELQQAILLQRAAILEQASVEANKARRNIEESLEEKP